MGMAAFAAVLVLEDIPGMEFMKEVGTEILYAGGWDDGNGQGMSGMMTELLGGQVYWNGNSEEEWQQLVLEENNGISEEQESVPENGNEGVVEDSDGFEQQSVATESRVEHKNAVVEKLKSTLDTSYLWKEFYIVDSTTSVTKDLFPVKKLLEKNLTIKKKKGKKQILIYHTHGASEYFSDSKNGSIEDSVVGVGDELAKELENLGYGVIHDRTRYDLINGSLERSLAYNKSLDGIEKHLSEHPELKVIIDLHRDSVGKGKHTYTTINGKKTAIAMFFNGMSRTKNGPIAYLHNSNLEGNLAFSLQLKCKAMEYYDGFTKPIYLKGYRYNLHLRERSLLIELGNENNTVEEVKNAASPLASVLDMVLSGQES
jgi:stage II sporulation protein P